MSVILTQIKRLPHQSATFFSTNVTLCNVAISQQKKIQIKKKYAKSYLHFNVFF